MTTRQVARGVGRTLRAMERDAQRTQRQRIAYEKAVAKQAMLDASAEAAENYEQFIAVLTQSHRVPFSRRDWASIAAPEPPCDPIRSDVREAAAKATLAKYRPGWFAKTFGIAGWKRKKLTDAIGRARRQDDHAYEEAQVEAARARDEINFARRVLAHDRAALSEALQAHANFAGMAIEGLHALFTNDRVIAMVDGVEVDDLPTNSVTLLQSGKASIKPLPASKIQELHRDSICCAAIRVAVEFLKALPLDAVEVVVHSDLLDSGSGHIEAQPVLYARITAQAVGAVNLAYAEPTPLAERLGAHFDWHRKEGMRPIDLDPFDIPSDPPLEEAT